MYLLNSSQYAFNYEPLLDDRAFCVANNSYLRSVSLNQLKREICNKNILVFVHEPQQSFADILTLFLSFKHQINKFAGHSYDTLIGCICLTEDGKDGNNNMIQNSQRLRKWLRHFQQCDCSIDMLSYGSASTIVYQALETSERISIRNLFWLGFLIPPEIVGNDYRMVTTVAEKINALYLFYTRTENISVNWLKLLRWRELFKYPATEQQQEFNIRLPQTTAVDCSDILEAKADYPYSQVGFEFIGKILLGKRYPQYYTL